MVALLQHAPFKHHVFFSFNYLRFKGLKYPEIGLKCCGEEVTGFQFPSWLRKILEDLSVAGAHSPAPV